MSNERAVRWTLELRIRGLGIEGADVDRVVSRLATDEARRRAIDDDGILQAAVRATLTESAQAALDPTLSDTLDDATNLTLFCTPSILPTQRMLIQPLRHELSVSHPDLGSLTSGGGHVKQISSAVCESYGCAEAHLFIDGSSGALRTIIEWIACYHQDPLVGISRAAHRAVIHHLTAFGVRWRYVEDSPTLNDVRDARFAEVDAVPPTRPSDVRAFVEKHSPTHLIINAVTYEGAVADMQGIVDAAGDVPAGHRNAVVIADEAWGAHFPFDPDLAEHQSSKNGADLVTTSLHKQGGSSQGTAALLVPESSVLDERSRRQLATVARSSSTTSPNYTMLASIQETLSRLDKKGRALRPLRDVGQHLVNCVVKDLHNDGYSVWTVPAGPRSNGAAGVHDPLKVTIKVPPTIGTGFQVAKWLVKQRQIVVESCTSNAILILITFTTDHTAANRLVDALRHLAADPIGDIDADPLPKLEPRAEPRVLTPADRERADRHPLADTAGHTCADIVSVYPPGIPLLVPGDKISPTMVGYLQTIRTNGGHVSTSAPEAVGDGVETTDGDEPIMPGAENNEEPSVLYVMTVAPDSGGENSDS